MEKHLRGTLLCDLDDTLCDTASRYAAGRRRIAEELYSGGYGTVDACNGVVYEAHKFLAEIEGKTSYDARYLVGMVELLPRAAKDAARPSRGEMRKALESAKAEPEKHERVSKIYKDVLNAPGELYSDVIDTLETIKKDYSFTIITIGEHKRQDRKIKMRGLERYLDVPAILSHDYRTEDKGTLCEIAMKQLGEIDMLADPIYFVDDKPKHIAEVSELKKKGVNIKPIHIARREPKDACKGVADFCISEFSELIPILYSPRA